jgi:hypothetical protein
MRPYRRWGSAGLLAGFALLSACARQPARTPPPGPDAHGQVSYRSDEPADESHYELALGQSAVQPTVLANPAPAYPPELVARGLPPVEVHAQLAVNGQGQVYNVIVAGEATADADRRRFIAAVREAVRRWRFSPLVIRHMAADAEGHSHVVDEERPPFSQFFAFRFEVKDGRAVSSVGAGAP